jgi:phosphatidylserine/phosphatidylglycerophosphate/cardiolipin synthase-like enzyme
MLTRRAIGISLLLCASLPACALQTTAPTAAFAASGTVQYAFTPGDAADGMIIAAVDEARQQILVQAYSFTHQRIAAALVRAQRRGVEVAVLLDTEQARGDSAVVRDLARGKVLLRYDHRHAAAHNKTMVIDAGLEQCAVITGSYNFSTAAQHRNAENALILRANPPLCTAYYDNWRRHYAHASIRR